MATFSSSQIEAPVKEGRDVYTTLNYTMPSGREGLKPIDSDIPEAERRNVQRKGLTDVREVLIKDIRGKEDEFTLNFQGFQFVKHQVDAVTDWTDQRQIKEIIQPATEDLVKEM